MRIFLGAWLVVGQCLVRDKIALRAVYYAHAALLA